LGLALLARRRHLEGTSRRNDVRPRTALRGYHRRTRRFDPGKGFEDRIVPQVRRGAVRRFPGELQLFPAWTVRVDRTRLAVADGTARHRVSLVSGDDLQLARLA